MAELTPSQLRTRERVEALIGAVAPALDAILNAGDRISRIVEPEDHDYYPARPLVEPDAPVVEPGAAAGGILEPGSTEPGNNEPSSPEPRGRR